MKIFKFIKARQPWPKTGKYLGRLGKQIAIDYQSILLRMFDGEEYWFWNDEIVLVKEI